MRAAHVLSPREAALRIADALFAGETGPPADPRTFDLASFQEDAVRRARKILRLRGGVLIADSVGLGKTYIALGLIEEELDRGGRVLVATPAALRRMWRAPLRRLAQAHHVTAAAGLGGAVDGGAGTPTDDRTGLRTPARTALTLISHARLSRGFDLDFIYATPVGPTFVVVDEAHAFRNPRTRRYRELARVSSSARVALLTATPVNNTLLDLYALIRLFASDTQFRDLGVQDLRALFHRAALRPDAPPAPALLGVLRAIMIRRARPLLRESHGAIPQRAADGRETTPTAGLRGRAGRSARPVVQPVRPPSRPGVRFPERAPPRVLRYDLEAKAPNLLDDAAACLDALTFAPLRVHAYGHRDASAGRASGVAELIRMLMLKRLESSVAALASSLAAQIAFVESFIEHLRSGRLLRPTDHRASRGTSDDAAVQLLLGGIALDPLPRTVDAHALEADAAEDLEHLRALQLRLPRHPVSCDAKLVRLRELIDGELAGERVLVFTEFRETARYLWAALRDRGGIALIHGGGAFLGRARCGRREAVERFAPLSNGAVTPPPREAVRVLIATDVLSEGMNLQDARHVVSYDLPWNPVRLIQRIGRIDRLGSTHDVVYSYAFIPQRGLDRLIGLLERIRIKLAAIHTGVGTEPCLPRELAPPAFLDRLARGDPRLLDEIERHDAAPFEAEERLRSAYLRVWPRTAVAGIRRSDARMAAAPPVIAVSASTSDPGGTRTQTRPSVLLAVRCRAHDVVRLGLRTPSGEILVDPPSAFDTLTTLIEGVPEDPHAGAAETGRLEPDRRAIAHALRELARWVENRAHSFANAADTPRHRRKSPAHSLSRRLLEALAQVPGGPDAQLCARAEKLLVRLGRGGRAGLDHALASLSASAAAPEDAVDLCNALETLFSADPLTRETKIGRAHV